MRVRTGMHPKYQSSFQLVHRIKSVVCHTDKLWARSAHFILSFLLACLLQFTAVNILETQNDKQMLFRTIM
jgi:hypothetical protein